MGLSGKLGIALQASFQSCASYGCSGSPWSCEVPGEVPLHVCGETSGWLWLLLLFVGVAPPFLLPAREGFIRPRRLASESPMPPRSKQISCVSENTMLGSCYFLTHPPAHTLWFYCVHGDRLLLENVCFLLLSGSFLYMTLIVMMVAGQDMASLHLGHSFWWMLQQLPAWCLNGLQSARLGKPLFPQLCVILSLQNLKLGSQWGKKHHRQEQHIH